jgi:hypothetical protein
MNFTLSRSLARRIIGGRDRSVYDRQQHYNTGLTQFEFMRPQAPSMPITEAYVSIPPALWIRDDEGALWTLGFDYSETEWRSGRYEYDVVRNGRKTGEFARQIEFRKPPGNNNSPRVVRIWGAEGWKSWNGRQFI